MYSHNLMISFPHNEYVISILKRKNNISPKVVKNTLEFHNRNACDKEAETWINQQVGSFHGQQTSPVLTWSHGGTWCSACQHNHCPFTLSVTSSTQPTKHTPRQLPIYTKLKSLSVQNIHQKRAHVITGASRPTREVKPGRMSLRHTGTSRISSIWF